MSSDTRDSALGAILAIVAVGMAIAVVLGTIFVWKWANPKMNLYQAEIEKRILVEDARARADSAEFLAQEEVTRAEGVARANEIIAESITDEYVTWLYVDQLDQIQGQVIYIPTEAGLPILEAGNR